MEAEKAVALFVAFLLLAAPMLISVPSWAQQTSGAPVRYSVEPFAVDPLVNLNSSMNGLETPATPSPVGKYFYVEIHLRGATSANVPVGVLAIEVHFDFSSILAYAEVVNFTGYLGTPDGVLNGPSSKIISAISPGFYDNSDNPVSGPPYTGAVRFEVASSSENPTGWNSPDGLVAVIYFQITGQPSSQLGQQDFVGSMNIIFGDVADANLAEVPFDVANGSLHIDASAPIQQTYALTVNVAGSGTVTQNPLNTTYPSGTVVTLTGVPTNGWAFQAWSGDVTGSQNPATVTMNANKTVTATFTQISVVNYTLAVNVVGSGSVTQSPSATSYSSGTVVTLTATGASGWSFQSWSGDVTGSQNPTTVTMNANKAVTATFTQVSVVNYTLAVNVVGSGSVTQSPSATSYSSGTVVTLTGVPANGWAFQAWSGDVTGSQNPTTVTMSANKAVTATFARVSVANYTLVLYVVGSGTVSESPAAEAYASGTVVTLTAVAAVNWTFQSWSGDLTGSQNPATLTMDGNKVVTVTFVQQTGLTHDVAVTTVKVSQSQVMVGAIVSVAVEASNLGGFTESFDVTVYSGSNLVQTVYVGSLAPHSSQDLTVEWSTGGVTPGVYTISASATVVEGDVNSENNFLADGSVTVTAAAPTMTSRVFTAVIFLFVGLAVLGGLIFMMFLAPHHPKRRKKKASWDSSHEILVHAC